MLLTNSANLYESGLPIDLSTVRNEVRVKIPIKLFIRRPINSTAYRHEVITTDVSSHGVQIVCDMPLEIGAQLIINGFNGRFSAIAAVKHIELRSDGKWAVGMHMECKIGDWVVQ